MLSKIQSCQCEATETSEPRLTNHAEIPSENWNQKMFPRKSEFASTGPEKDWRTGGSSSLRVRQHTRTASVSETCTSVRKNPTVKMYMFKLWSNNTNTKKNKSSQGPFCWSLHFFWSHSNWMPGFQLFGLVFAFFGLMGFCWFKRPAFNAGRLHALPG